MIAAILAILLSVSSELDKRPIEKNKIPINELIIQSGSL